MKKEKFILLAGGMGAGKDTMREELIKELGIEKEYHFSFATPLKDEADKVIEAIQANLGNGEIGTILNVEASVIQEVRDILGKDIIKQYPKVNARSRTPEIRKFLQYWGTDVRRKSDMNYWVNIAKSVVRGKLDEGYTVIITDARFNNEFELSQALGGTTVCLYSSEDVRVSRVENRDGLTPSRDALDHRSELDWRDYENFDIVIDSNELTVKETVNLLIQEIERKELVL